MLANFFLKKYIYTLHIYKKQKSKQKSKNQKFLAVKQTHTLFFSLKNKR